MKTKDDVRALDRGLRHKSGMKDHDFVSHYTKVFSQYAYATKDDSWNEFEKEITHVLGMFIYHKRFCEIIGLTNEDGGGFDPRDFVWEYEDKLAEKPISPDINQLLKDIISRA